MTFGSTYCLNYVGCKGKTVSMVEYLERSIALTMWDVKFRFSPSIVTWFIPYCLNYVGCKGWLRF